MDTSALNVIRELVDDSSSSDDESWDLDSSSDDEELLFEEREVPKNEGFFAIVDTFDEQLFSEHFRVSRDVAEKVALEFEGSRFFNLETGGNGKLTALQQTLIFLWFAGHQTSSFRDVADRFHITISSLHRVSRRLTYFLSGLSKRIIQWPSEDEKRRISEGFEHLGFLPNVIGAVDGSHIKIDRPSVDAESYCNRKKYFSIQLQATCDDRMRITSLFVGFPGSVHDARVFKRSTLGQNLQDRCGEFVVLGDSAYPCSRNLLTPFKDTGTLTQRKKNYNKKLSKCRCVIEHCFGILKQRFRQLYHCKLRSISDISHFIRACCVLHNLALDDDFPTEEETSRDENMTEMEYNEDAEDEVADAPNGIAFRNYILSLDMFN